MSTASNPDNNLSPWKPGQSGNPSGRPRGTRDLAGYVIETTDGGKELVDALVSIARGIMPSVPVQEGSRPRKDQQARLADQTGRPAGYGRPWKYRTRSICFDYLRYIPCLSRAQFFQVFFQVPLVHPWTTMDAYGIVLRLKMGG